MNLLDAFRAWIESMHHLLHVAARARSRARAMELARQRAADLNLDLDPPADPGRSGHFRRYRDSDDDGF